MIGDTEQHNFRRSDQPLTAASGHNTLYHATCIKDLPEPSLSIPKATALADSHSAHKVHCGHNQGPKALLLNLFAFTVPLLYPEELSWTILRYTDPDAPLAQADEDKLLGFNPPAVVEKWKFMALKINMSLGTAAYATMALLRGKRVRTISRL